LIYKSAPNIKGWQRACEETGKVFIYEEMTACEAMFNLKQLTLTVEKNVPTASYPLKDGELGDSTGVDRRIVDPGGIRRRVR